MEAIRPELDGARAHFSKRKEKKKTLVCIEEFIRGKSEKMNCDPRKPEVVTFSLKS